MVVNRIIEKEENIDIVEATLLTVNEYKLYQNFIPLLDKDWWLRPSDTDSDSAPCVNYLNSETYIIYAQDISVAAVRPVLKINADLNIGDKFTIGEYSFTVISKLYAIVDFEIDECQFTKTSVKEIIDDWFTMLKTFLDKKSDNTVADMTEVLYKVDNDAVEEQMTAMLTDPDISTHDMFEDLVTAYDAGNEDFRKGMDKALETLIWKNLPEIVEYMETNCSLERR